MLGGYSIEDKLSTQGGNYVLNRLGVEAVRSGT